MWQNLLISLSLSAGIGMCCIANAVPDTSANSVNYQMTLDNTLFGASNDNTYILGGSSLTEEDYVANSSAMMTLFDNDYITYAYLCSLYSWRTSGVNSLYSFDFFISIEDGVGIYNPNMRVEYVFTNTVSSYGLLYYLNGYQYNSEFVLWNSSVISYNYSTYEAFTYDSHTFLHFKLPTLTTQSTYTLESVNFTFTLKKYSNDYVNGYNAGFTDGQNSAPTENVEFLDLFASIADTPILFIHGLFSFDLFGTSMLVIVLSLLTAIMVIALIKKFWK